MPQPLAADAVLRTRQMDVDRYTGVLSEVTVIANYKSMRSWERAPVPGGPVNVAGLGRDMCEERRREVHPLPNWKLQRVEAYIWDHIGDCVSLADLAGVAGLSRMHFAAQFRARTGRRPHEHLLLRRIEQAKAILTSVDMPIVEVALAVGFQAQSHFSTVFKKFSGSSPAAWRRRNRSSKVLGISSDC